jgi:hypothetical protein
MSETSMTAVVEYGPNQLKLESVPIPTAAANEVVIEIEACGVCTSDVKPGTALPDIGEVTTSRNGSESRLYPDTNLLATLSSSAQKSRDSQLVNA